MKDNGRPLSAARLPCGAPDGLLHIEPMALPRRLLIANALAIMAVVANHASQWGVISMLWWADSYLPIESLPDLSTFDSIHYYLLVGSFVFTHFSVPVFLFVSGYFIAYALVPDRIMRRQWKIIGSRVNRMLVPYLVWSVGVFTTRWLESCEEVCQLEPIATYANQLLFGNAVGAYYYILILVVLFVLSPIILAVARIHWRALLMVTWFIQIGVLLTGYLQPSLVAKLRPRGDLLHFSILTFYFVLGIVFRMQSERFKHITRRARPYLPSVIALLGIAAFADVAWFSESARSVSIFTHRSLLAYLFATSVVLSLIAVERLPTLGTKFLLELSSAVFGIYLLHPIVLEYLARAVHRLTPWFLAYPIAFQVYLVAGGIGLPLLFMSAVKRSPFRRFYRYLFG
jgi:surface polysaccharide O-acyltransferase-like enzyme